MTDFKIENHGSVFLFLPLTEAAREHVEEEVRPEGWQRMGEGFAVEHRVAFDLTDALVGEGFTVE